MDSLTTDNRQLTTERVAAIRHAVYTSLIGYLPYASSDQVFRFLAKRRKPWADRLGFLELRVTPDIGETNGGATLPEIEQWLNRKYGERLAHVPGFYRLPATGYRLNMPRACAVHAYGPHRFIAGLLFQPIGGKERTGVSAFRDSFFLLSSAKYGGPRATRLSGEDQMYFTQFEEVTV